MCEMQRSSIPTVIPIPDATTLGMKIGANGQLCSMLQSPMRILVDRCMDRQTDSLYRPNRRKSSRLRPHDDRKQSMHAFSTGHEVVSMIILAILYLHMVQRSIQKQTSCHILSLYASKR